MATTTLSTKNQIVIPKDVRESLDLKPGTQFEVLVKDGMIMLVQRRSLEQLQAVFRGADLGGYRDRSDIGEPGWS